MSHYTKATINVASFIVNWLFWTRIDGRMSVFLFAVVDPDVCQPPSSITYVREKVSFPPESSLIEVFIILSSTTFSHLPHLSSRGLDIVIFNGKQMDSEQNMTVSISDLMELWHLVLLDFSKIFHITFQLHRSKKTSSQQKETGSAVLFSIFMSPPDRAAIRAAREDNEKGEFLPLSRSEWCIVSDWQ